ncbi:site-specific recombinase [Pandoraea communis]|uniref:Site-specific recombinase transmembrane protein n=1 Tax=Pandoraea communis TaxID=2508297 RepID=A0A5E4U7U9_9BURK|nr:site-specific recombinase [Pandoraea communis]MDM8356360.1 site-specific recombinase [Pandoraea communis]VVD95158.1 site-specific recombinase transmembrane protein [Pandoraea communis]
MLNSLNSYWRKWRASRHAGHQLDELLAHADPSAPLAVRNQWLIELAHWVQKRGALVNEVEVREAGEAARYRPHTRLRYLLQMLDRNPVWRLPVARTLRSVIHESDAISLLCDTGLPVRPGFWGALVERIEKALIPPPPTRRDLSALCSLMFPDGDAADWIAAMPPELLADLIALLHYGEDEDDDADWNPFADDLLAAMHHLVDQIASTGLSQAVRSRLTYPRATESPFYRLGRAMQELEDAGQAFAHGAPPSQHFVQHINVFRALLDDCGRAARQVYAHLDENGVSVDIVFQVERAKARIRRLERLLEAWLTQADEDRATARVRLFADLVRANRASQSVGELARTSFGLLARKVVERSAETGEHYIARNRSEYFAMLKMACGGGLVTVVTVYVKFLIVSMHLPTVVEGFLAGANYALCFLFMHFCHFTLATKQPAMTAPAIASKLDDVDTPAGMDAFVGEVIALVRTQAAAIFGNLAMVFPFCLLVQWAVSVALGVNTISPEKAHATLTSFSIFGVTPLFAILTGVLLWFSSLISGWADNWFALHGIGDVLAYNRRLRFVFGRNGAARLADGCRRHIAPVLGNLTLGFMLGLVPAVLTAFALPFEVRHVTLSTGSIATSIGVLGIPVLHDSALWLAVAGVGSMALLNVGVSFALAFHMALRSRPLRLGDRRQIHRAIWRAVLRNPLVLLFPLRSPQRDARPDK